MRESYHHNGGFKSDAAYFDLMSQQPWSKADQRALREVAATYRTLAKTERAFGAQKDHWDKRAEKCRALAGQFKSTICRTQLLRLADTYEILADSDLDSGEL